MRDLLDEARPVVSVVAPPCDMRRDDLRCVGRKRVQGRRRTTACSRMRGTCVVDVGKAQGWRVVQRPLFEEPSVVSNCSPE